MESDSRPASKIANPEADPPRSPGQDPAPASATQAATHAPTQAPGVPLPSLGEGFDAGVNEATHRVEIRRKALPTYSFSNDQAIDVFAAQRKLSEVDREALHALDRVAQARRQRVVADVAGVLTEAAGKTWLAVPFAEKDPARDAGARWDKEAKAWFAPPGADLRQLERWAPRRAVAQEAGRKQHLDPKAEFATAIQLAGLVLDGDPLMDGTLHRVPVVGAKEGARDGAYVGHLDGRPSGHIQNFRTGHKENWTSAGMQLTAQELAQLAAQAQLAKQQRASDLSERHAKAAERAQAKWERFSDTPADGENAYLSRKGVGAHGVKFDGQKLIVPLRDVDGKLWSVQSISPGEGARKLFDKGARKTGNMHVLGDLQPGAVVLVAEGYATAASLHEATGRAVVVAFDSGNLDSVVGAIKQRYPANPVFIMGDDDRHQPLNVGVQQAIAAARKHHVGVAFPEFHDGAKLSDFNDLHSQEGLQAVKLQVDRTLEKSMEQSRDQAAQLATGVSKSPPSDRPEQAGERLTASDAAIGAAHAAQLMQAGGPLAHTAVQAVGIADAVKVASDVAQGKEVRALDVASASASVAMTTGMGGPAVQLAAQGVAAVSAVDAGRRAMNTLEEKVSEAVDVQTPPPLPRTQTSAAAAPASSDKPVPEQQIATVVANSIEHVSPRELQAESPDTAELRKQLLAERSSTGPEASSSSPSQSSSRPDAGSAAAPSTEAAREKEARDREIIARMTRPELDEYVAARKVSEERVDQVLRAAQQRIEAETDRPGVRAYPPLEERFNIKRHLLRRDFEFRDQPGKVAFTERWLSMKSTTHSAAVVKAMVDRAEERGWTAVRVKGSAEFERQVWISATARGIKALGYEPTDGDRLAMAQERERLNAERGQAHAQGGGTITREATREREMPAWADPNARELREVPGDIQRDGTRRPGFARRGPAQSVRESAPREPAIARALRPLLAERGESAEDTAAIVAVASRQLRHERVYAGKVLEHGQAPYQFDDKNALNYFLKLHTPSGEKTVWSVDLERALEEGRIQIGDSIALEHRGVTPVSVVITDRDAAGRIVGSHDEVVDRNTWYAANVEQLRAEALDRSAPDRTRGTEPGQEVEGAAKPTVAKPIQAVEQAQQTEPRSHAREALVFEALEAAFAAKNVPAELRDGLRKTVQKELDLRSARGEPVDIGVLDPGAPRPLARTVRVPQRQPQAHDRSR